jgi:ABC-type bacteriocin/lantibiotic exporter with double-glycine peptidase domain
LQGSTLGPQLESESSFTQRIDSSAPQVALQSAPSLHIENLSYRYPGGDAVVFDGLNLDVPAGTCLGIVGHSGAGKSTLLALVLGILEPSGGKLWFDVDSQSFMPRSARIPLGYVGAEPFLIAGTVAENLLYGASENFSKEQMIGALINAGFADDAHDWNKFLQSPISEDGEGLSTGQKQRLCLARALLVNPKLLVLDEVSANLDVQAEEKIAEYVKRLKGRCTVIIVSHRPGMLKACDQLFDILAREVTARS